jgi:hypothetical protein
MPGPVLPYVFAKTEITFPRVESDLLMFAPSASLAPSAPVEPALSEPAKSIKFMLETSSRSGYPFSRKLFCLKTICVTV